MLDVVINGMVFPPKATRHIVPARLVAVNVPLSLLMNREISLEEANMSLAKMINIKKVKRIEVGSLWTDRTSDEVLYVFSERARPLGDLIESHSK